ncbi:YceH family protein [Rhodocaloribacter sp.]
MEPTLTAEEVRVLGALVEKEQSTPDHYPLTLSALTAACNQKSSRHPVVAYTTEEVLRALDGLHRKRLAGRVTGGGSRVTKYVHALKEAWGLSEAERAALAVLMLRGPQTAGEIRSRTGRMHDFESLDAVAHTLDALAAHEPPLVVRLPRLPGRKEARFAHLLAGMPDVEALAAEHAPFAGPAETSRLARLEAEVTALRDRLETLEAAFHAFRKEFE